jgi:sucrose phosphorylase
LVTKWGEIQSTNRGFVDKSDIILITYGDSLVREGECPLETLGEFSARYFKDIISAIHILPMYPFSSDDGFSVVDYKVINEDLGNWENIGALKENFDLMFDAVLNHASVSSQYFMHFLDNTKDFEKFFISADPSLDYHMVTRPRALPLLTEFRTARGTEWIWTTFSSDQADFNYKDPNVLLEILDIVLLYVSKGCRYLRLDAIGLIWKEIGTTCMHLPQTHAIIKLIRNVVELCSDGCIIVTETNVNSADNISYFGNGSDEAGLVYQFPLPPLVLFSFVSGDAAKLSRWAASLDPVGEHTAFLNFLSSHDGIGMRPAEDILSEEEKKLLSDSILWKGGRINYRYDTCGNKIPYEFNINYCDAISAPSDTDSLRAQKTLTAHSILLSLAGVPLIYIHSILGSRNWEAGITESGINRRINREKLNADAVMEELNDKKSLRATVYSGFLKMIAARKSCAAFEPSARQEILSLDAKVFACIRGEKADRVLCIANVSESSILVRDLAGNDLLCGKKYGAVFKIEAYSFLWIKLD